MDRQTAARIIEDYMKPVYGFALRRCASPQDAEDLAQEICLKLYRSLSSRDDIASTDAFVWTVARHALANYYRGRQRAGVGLPLDDLLETLPTGRDACAPLLQAEEEKALHRAIAYLSGIQRRVVVAYYFENKRQETIAAQLGSPLGTVKWHLFEAKKELKKGLERMRPLGELKFHPVTFALCGTNGSVGAKGGCQNFFRSALAQNIAYALLRGDKTVNQLADALGVSPVYVESEAAYLTEYGFLLRQGNAYRLNILLDEPTAELTRLQSEMYQKAAALFAPALYEKLIDSGLLDGEHGVLCPVHPDENFLLWALIPYIAALSGEKGRKHPISFEEAATLRPDGGQNICYASVLDPDVPPPLYFEEMTRFCGPCWNASEHWTLWQVDSEWSAARVNDGYQQIVRQDLSLLERFFRDEPLSPDEYARLAERGYLQTAGAPDKLFTASLQVVWIRDAAARDALLAIGERLKDEYRAALDELKAPYVQAVLAVTPGHLRRMQGFGLQYIFYADGWFLLHCMKELVNRGLLRLPSLEEKRSLSMLLVPND